MSADETDGMSTLEYHVLLALASGPLHGYGLKDAVAEESSGTLTPRAGSMYRVIARLMTADFVLEAESPAEREPHPGLARKYYALSVRGRTALAVESRRLKAAATVAERRLGVIRSRT